MKTILVADDEYGIAEALAFILTDSGYRVVTAQDGEEALRLLHQTNPDLVLLDFMMPTMDGAEALQAIRQDPTFHEVPVLMMSAVGEGNVRAACSGLTAFLRKPFCIDDLLEQVTRLIGAGSEALDTTSAHPQ